MQKIKFFFLILFIIYRLSSITHQQLFAQEGEIEFTIDASANTIPLPVIFKPNIDLSGRGFSRDALWPQELAAKEVLAGWQKDIGFSGFYRLQYNLWEIHQLEKNKDLQNKLLVNYENIIKNISDSGGTVILDIFGTPAGLGRVLDKRSPPLDLKAFKALVKEAIRDLSCNKKYNIWYEVWNAPDLDDFFLGRKQEYFNLYRAVAESVKELENETKIHIPVGGPSVSWWFQDLDGNSIITPERSLIYELIKFCYKYRLPLDFISWHSYSTNPAAEKENSIYKKPAITLIRDWLSYFNFDRNTPLIVDEWNYDRSANVLPERKEKSYVAASYITSRLKNMYEAGINCQIYFALEDFQDNKEGIVRNVGIFSFDSEYLEYKGGPKSIYNIFKMLKNLGNGLFTSKLNDDFTGAIATKSGEDIAVIIYNYIDPEIATNFLTMNITALNGAERKTLLSIINSNKLEKIMSKSESISSLKASQKLKELLKRAQELNERAKKIETSERNIKLSINNLKDRYLYQRYTIDSSCVYNCEFMPLEEKEINFTGAYQETLTLKPYSVQMVLLKKKPKEEQAQPVKEPLEKQDDTRSIHGN